MEEDVVHGATERLFQYGVLGIMVVVFGLVIFLLWRENSKKERDYTTRLITEAKKVEDLQKEHAVILAAMRVEYDTKLERIWQQRLQDKDGMQERFTSMVKESTIAMGSVVGMLESTKETMSEVKDTMKIISTDIRTSRRP